MSYANKKLQLAAMDNTKVFDIESLEDNDSPHIEMDLMLGVADLNTPKAIAAAEFAVNGNQPVLSFAATIDSSDEDENDDSDSTSDDEHKEQSGCGRHDQGKDDRKLKCSSVNMKRVMIFQDTFLNMRTEFCTLKLYLSVLCKRMIVQ